jgi:hypothetical protein
VEDIISQHGLSPHGNDVIKTGRWDRFLQKEIIVFPHFTKPASDSSIPL